MPKRIKLTLEHVKERCLNLGFTLLSDYINANSNITMKCYCGKEFTARADSILSNKQKSCGCYKHQVQFRGCKDLSGHYWAKIKNGAKKRGIEFNITIEYVWDLFLKQDRKCLLSGTELKLESNAKKYGKDSSLQTASLDRVNNKLGYIEGNVRWVHKDVNWLRHKYTGDFTDSELIELCTKIANHNKEHT